MPSLPEAQRRFAAALEARTPSPAPGFDVYRQSIRSVYRRALAATYPVVRALVGAAFFDAAVDAFVAAHPSTSGDLNVYGGELARFLARYEPASTLPYLPDVARLEWALDESARAADVEADPRALVAAISLVEEDVVSALRLVLHPSCRLLATRFAVFEIWKVHQPGYRDDMRVAVGGAGTEFLLARRSGDDPLVERVSPGEFAWLRALDEGAGFGAALARALEADAAFDLAEALEARVMDGTVSALAP